MKIYKYKIKVTDEQQIKMPIGAKILCCAEQSNELFIWAIVNMKADTTDYGIRIFGTGQDFPDNNSLSYISTVQTVEGFMWHVFEVRTS